MEKREIVLIVIVGLFCFTWGFIIGAYSTMNWVVNLGIKFIEAQGIEFPFTAPLVTEAIFMYQNQISNYIELKGGNLTND